jgi:hypothetical protein
VELPATESDKIVGVYDMSFRLRSGHGPAAADPVVREAAKGVVADGKTDSDLVVAVPVSSSENVVGVVRASVPDAVVWQHVILAWLLMAALAMGSLLVAILVARRQARLLQRFLQKPGYTGRHQVFVVLKARPVDLLMLNQLDLHSGAQRDFDGRAGDHRGLRAALVQPAAVRLGPGLPLAREFVLPRGAELRVGRDVPAPDQQIDEEVQQDE